MKKMMYIRLKIAVCAILLSATMFSCVKEEIAESQMTYGDSIRFGISSANDKKGQPKTKSGAVESEPYVIHGEGITATVTVVDGIQSKMNDMPLTKGTQATSVSAFNVVAYLYPDGATSGVDYFSDLVSDGVNPATTRYWPEFGTLDFLAAAPAGIISTMPSASDYENGFSFTYAIPEEVAEQQDIMVAVAKDQNNSSTGNPVPLQFQHLLAAVQFKVGKVVACDIQKIEIKGVNIGTVSFTYNKSNDSWQSSLQTTNLKDFIFEFDKDELEEVAGAEINGNSKNTMLLIPEQSFNDNTVQIVVTYDDLLTETQDPVTKSAYLPAGSWRKSTTTTYSINIEVEGIIIPSPEEQDAHYVMVDMPYDLSALSSTITNLQAEAQLYDSNGNLITGENQQVTMKFAENLTLLQTQNYWTEYQIIDGQTTKTYVRGESILDLSSKKSGTIVLFVPENMSTEDRTGVLVVSGKLGDDKVVLGGGYFVQKCPSWSYDEVNKKYIGVERIEEEYAEDDDKLYPYGFSWSRKITYDNSQFIYRVLFTNTLSSTIGVDDVIANLSVNTESSWILGTVTSYGVPYTALNGFIKYWIAESGIGGLLGNYICRIQLDYTAVSNLNNVALNNDGKTNTVNLYNFTAGINVSDFETQLDALSYLTKNADTAENQVSNDYAAFTAIKKNKFYELVTTETQDGKEVTIYTPKVEDSNIDWYLPSSAQAQYIIDTDKYILDGNYWSSTAVKDDNTLSYYYKFINGSYSSIGTANRITTSTYLGNKVRAVIDWAGTASPIANDN